MFKKKFFFQLFLIKPLCTARSVECAFFFKKLIKIIHEIESLYYTLFKKV